MAANEQRSATKSYIGGARAETLIVRLDAAHVVRVWPIAAERLLGIRSEDALGRQLSSILPFFAGARGEVEAWFERHDGQLLRLATCLIAPGDDDAAQLGLLVRDITAQFHRREERRQARAQLGVMTARLGGLVPFSIDTRDGLTSRSLRELLASERGGLAGLVAACHPDGRRELERALEEGAARGQLDVELRLADGRWIQLVGVFVGEPRPRLVGTALDVSLRHLAEPLRGREAGWRALLAASRDGVLVIDADGSIAEVNDALCALVRASAFALVGAPWQAILVATSPGLPSPGSLHTLSGRRADNTTFPVECRLAEVDGVPGRVVCVVHDLTEKILVERRIVEASEQLQRRVGADLHDGLGQLLTGTAFLAKGLEASVPAGQQPQAARVVELVNQAIARVRNLARGLNPLPSEEETLETVLRDMVAESSKLFGLECRFERRDPVFGVRPAAVAQLGLIAREAITNAVRHGHAGRIVVSLAHPGARSLLSIEDDGVGISPPDRLVEGLGLRSMRARAHHIGGTLEVARAEVGTVVRCWWNE